MNLKEARRLFFKLRSENRIDVCEDHVIGGHPERGYSMDEVVSLVKGSGRLQDTTERRFVGDRFYWRTKDLQENAVRLVVEFDEDNAGQVILVISAGERT